MANKQRIVVGIDVSMDKLSYSIYDGKLHTTNEIPYTKESINRHLVRKFKDVDNLLFVMEATGIYHTKLVAQLKEFKVAVVNPLVIKHYSKLKLGRTKSDLFDARVIAEYGYKEDTTLYTPPSKEIVELRLLLKAVEDLLKQRGEIASQIHSLKRRADTLSYIIDSYIRHKEFITKEIDELKAKIESILVESFSNSYELLKSIGGIAMMGAATIIATFDSFKSFSSAKEAASFIGIAPSVYESGVSVRRKGSISKRGSSLARGQLFMNSLSAIRVNSRLKEYYNSLLARGKSKNASLIAVAHKIVRVAFALLKHNRAFTLDYTPQKPVVVTLNNKESA
ncbi:MAG: transposase [Sulfuricurvum sp.]|jgi:transposase